MLSHFITCRQWFLQRSLLLWTPWFLLLISVYNYTMTTCGLWLVLRSIQLKLTIILPYPQFYHTSPVMNTRASQGISSSLKNSLRLSRAHSRSESLNSYCNKNVSNVCLKAQLFVTLMFHPKGPNFFRSWIMAWKKHIPNTNFRQVTPKTTNENEYKNK